MQPLAHTTSIMSWSLLLSAIRRICENESSLNPIDLNLEAPPTAILCCAALEAFANEISSLTSAFLCNEEKDSRAGYSTVAQREADIGMRRDDCQAIARIKDNRKGSFYDRYKALLKAAGIAMPKFMPCLTHLCDLRDAFVHFRACDVSVVEDPNGVIYYTQKQPKVLAHLKSCKEHGWPVVATEAGTIDGVWALRVSTNAMAAWSLSLTLEAILHVLYQLPAGELRNFILRRYVASGVSFSTVFEMGKTKVEEWKNGLFLAS
jgi:hypothetical protein